MAKLDAGGYKMSYTAECRGRSKVFDLVEPYASQKLIERPGIKEHPRRPVPVCKTAGKRVHRRFARRNARRSTGRIVENHTAPGGQRCDKGQRCQSVLRARIRRNADPGKEADFAGLKPRASERRRESLVSGGTADFEDQQILRPL